MEAIHDEYEDFFHNGDPFCFLEQQERDEDKRGLCQQNGVRLYVIPYERDESKLRQAIRTVTAAQSSIWTQVEAIGTRTVPF